MLSWNEIRVRAAQFSREWVDAAYEKGETQTFYNEFFEVFGKRRRDVARFEEHVKKLDNRSGFIDLFWPSALLVEQKSAGHSLSGQTRLPRSSCAQRRAAHPGATLAELYDLDFMPSDLCRAHRNLDRAVERLYCTRPTFKSESERFQCLSGLYQQMTANLNTNRGER